MLNLILVLFEKLLMNPKAFNFTPDKLSRLLRKFAKIAKVSTPKVV